jgi:hypothetical protein
MLCMLIHRLTVVALPVKQTSLEVQFSVGEVRVTWANWYLIYIPSIPKGHGKHTYLFAWKLVYCIAYFYAYVFDAVYLHTKFHMPNSNSPLVIAGKQKADILHCIKQLY